jgi:hypothetical protein
MRRWRTTGVLLVAPGSLALIPKHFVVLSVILMLLLRAPTGFAQKTESMPPGIDALGVHNVGGRGCGGCHAPHADMGSSGAGVPGRLGLWQPIPPPATHQTITFGQDSHRVQVDSTSLATPGAEVAGVVLCLSCHDGNLTLQNMLANQPYEQAVGLRPSSGRQQIQSLLDEADLPGTTAVDHPFGTAARIEVGNGLVFRNGEFAMIPGSPYAQFVANYGWPSLAPRLRSNPYGIDQLGRPYLVCTTCHNQHAMNMYASSPGSPIAGDGGSGRYATFFFVNGPYNPNIHTTGQIASPSSAQFCRQCHFRFSNEANNVNTIRTLF